MSRILSQHVVEAEEDTVTGSIATTMETLLKSTNHMALLYADAHQSPESQAFKNIVFKLNGYQSIPVSVFNDDWSHGVSGVAVKDEAAQRILNMSDEERAQLAQKLADSIPNELRQQNIQVGPSFPSTGSSDTESWIAGFDAANECVGFYITHEVRKHPCGLPGIDRVHRTLYLIAKGGSSRAGQEFHVKFTEQIRAAKSLSEIGSLTEDMRRLHQVSRRKRCRLLYMAAQIFGIEDEISSTSDHTAHDQDASTRVAVPQFDVHTNQLHNDDTDSSKPWYYYAGAVNGNLSQGIIAVSNMTDGMILFRKTVDGELGAQIRNGFFNSIPFGSVRTSSVLDTYTAALKKIQDRTLPHPDKEWIQQRFAWMGLKGKDKDILNAHPAPLWGSHARLTWSIHPSPDLNLNEFEPAHLQPLCVAISGTERMKLKAVTQHLKKHV
jgi:hypothetical protein